MFITVPFQVRSITDKLQPFQSGSVFTSALFGERTFTSTELYLLHMVLGGIHK